MSSEKEKQPKTDRTTRYRENIVLALYSAGISKRQVCAMVKLHRSTVTRIIRENPDRLDEMNRHIVKAILNASAIQTMEILANPRKKKEKTYPTFPKQPQGQPKDGVMPVEKKA